MRKKIILEEKGTKKYSGIFKRNFSGNFKKFFFRIFNPTNYGFSRKNFKIKKIKIN